MHVGTYPDSSLGYVRNGREFGVVHQAWSDRMSLERLVATKYNVRARALMACHSP
jgi:hypothetical protein